MRLRRYLVNERRMKSERIEVYHGTSSKFLHKILKQGLIVDPKAKVWKDDPNASSIQASRQSLDGIYLANDWYTAYSAGNNASRKFGGNTIIVTVLFQPRASIPDEDNMRYYLNSMIQTAVGTGFSEYHYALTLAFLVLGGARMKSEAKRIIKVYMKSIKAYMKRLNIDNRALNEEIAINFLKAELIRSLSYAYHKKDNRYYVKKAWLEAYGLALGKALTGSDEDIKLADKANKILDKTIPKPSVAEQNYLKSLDAMTRMFKQQRMEYKEDKYTNFRSLEDITYKGRNRITSVVELQQDKRFYKGVDLDSKEGYEKYLKGKNQGEFESIVDDAENVDVLKVHYGKLSTVFIHEYETRVGPNYKVVKA